MIQPMKCQPVDAVPEDDPALILEPKYDGWRGLFSHAGADGSDGLRSSTGKAIKSVPYIELALAQVPEGTILDGEIVNLDGSAQWNKAQSICSRNAEHVPSADDKPLTFVVFDVIELMGRDVKAEPLSERKKLLEMLFKLLDPNPAIVRLAEALPCTQAELERLVDEGWEGVVIKDLRSTYQPGSRGFHWMKCKPETEVDVEITGMYDPEKGSKYEGRAVGGFEFAYTQNKGTLVNRLVKGRCGTGMDDVVREQMARCPENFIGKIAVVKHWGIGEQGALRFPSLKRIRDVADKAVAEPQVAVSNGSSKSRLMLDKMLAAEEECAGWKDRALKAEAKLRGLSKNGGKRMRNYSAMKDGKLITTREDLRRGAGEGHERALEGSGDPAKDLRVVEDLCNQKGLA